MKQGRRQFLRAVGGAGLLTLAGCSGSSDTTTEPESNPSETETEDEPTDDETAGMDDSSEPLTPPTEQTATLVPDDRGAGDFFGRSVSASADGTTALATAWGDSRSGSNFAGSAYIFEQSGGSWGQQAKLLPDDGDGEDRFGWAGDMTDAGTTALVGAPRDEDPNGPEAGSAYVFEASGSGWSQAAKLVPDDGTPAAHFGQSVALSNEGTLLVGAPGDGIENGEDTGSAYVFARSGTSWRQQTKFSPDDIDVDDEFGWEVSISSDGTTAVVGAADRGIAYVFRNTGSEWNRQATLTPEDGESVPRFGTALEVSGDGSRLVIGESSEDGMGAGHVYRAAGDGWERQTTLTPDDGSENGSFGSAIAVSSDGALVLLGAPGDSDPNGEGAGSATVFGNSGSGWRRQTTLSASDGDTEDYFGDTVSLSADGTTALAGAFGVDTQDGDFAGSAYVFE